MLYISVEQNSVRVAQGFPCAGTSVILMSPREGLALDGMACGASTGQRVCAPPQRPTCRPHPRPGPTGSGVLGRIFSSARTPASCCGQWGN